MESLESKLDRLSPDQRKEIEDFVDFLLSRAGPACTSMNSSCNPPPVLNLSPPLLSVIEPARAEETQPIRLQDLPRTDEQTIPAVADESESPLFQEISNGSDRITQNYMDYAQFEHPPSPATEAVIKVKRKIIAREEEEKPRHLLDWVD